MVELLFEPVGVALLVGVGGLCVVEGLKAVLKFMVSHLDEGP